MDTSVFGGVFDEEFRTPSERFFAAVRERTFVILASEALVLEISSAPAPVRTIFEAHGAQVEVLETTTEATALAEAYLSARVVPRGARVDALHVLASVARADAVVSWNFRLLVQPRRIRGFHAVNELRGYPLIEIRSPLEVIDDET